MKAWQVLIVATVLAFGPGDFALAGWAVAIRTALENCQNDNLDPDARIEACGQLIHANILRHDFLSVIYNDRGVAYEAKHDLDHAMQDYEKALELKPDLAEAQANHARLVDQEKPAQSAPATP